MAAATAGLSGKPSVGQMKTALHAIRRCLVSICKSFIGGLWSYKKKWSGSGQN